MFVFSKDLAALSEYAVVVEIYIPSGKENSAIWTSDSEEDATKFFHQCLDVILCFCMESQSNLACCVVLTCRNL